MFEHRKQRLVSRKHFLLRMLRSLALGLLIIFASLLFGMWGYHHFEGMPWIDAYVEAAILQSIEFLIVSLFDRSSEERLSSVGCFLVRPSIVYLN